MTETSPQRRPWFVFSKPDIVPENQFTEDALARHKREGMELAVRARIVAMTVIIVMLLFIVPWPDVLYYHVLAVLFMLIGLAQRRVGRVGTSRAELALLFCDLLLMTIIATLPNPLSELKAPLTFTYESETFKFFFLLLAMATLTYSWRTIIAVGTWTAGLWMGMALLISMFNGETSAWTEAIQTALPGAHEFVYYAVDPSQMKWDFRIQDVVAFMLCAIILAVSVRRSNQLLLAQAAVERERANLARYFSPNVVEELSNNDDPLKQVRSQNIAVLFVDIVGFTTFAAERTPQAVITTLRDFHGRMEACVFQYNGTLDKYLGDGLMATFGTPTPGPQDAVNALQAAHAMVQVVEEWNQERSAAGEPPIRASFGLHFGPVVVGDIGANRLEYAVIGNTVNVASRLEALSRPLGVRMVASEALVAEVKAEGGLPTPDLLNTAPPQEIRGIDGTMGVWTMA